MGGRSRSVKHQDKWDWIKELSNERLENYGYMSSKQSTFSDGVENISKSSLNYFAGKEFESRHGMLPSWYKK